MRKEDASLSREKAEKIMMVLSPNMVQGRFIRMIRLTLSSALRKVVNAKHISTELMEFGDYIDQLPTPISLNLYRMDPFLGISILHIYPEDLSKIIDIFFGGCNKSYDFTEGRNWSTIERGFLKQIVVSTVEDQVMAWRGHYPVTGNYIRSEINPVFVAIVPKKEIVAITTIEMDAGTHKFRFSFCQPVSGMLPLARYVRLSNALPVEIFTDLKNLAYMGLNRIGMSSWWKEVKPQFSGMMKDKLPTFFPKDRNTVENQSEPTVEKISELNSAELAALPEVLSKEHPQTIALVCSKILDPKQSQSVIKKLDVNTQVDVLDRISNLDSIVPGVIEEVERLLLQALRQFPKTEKPDCDQMAIDLAKSLSKKDLKALLPKLEVENQKLCASLRKQLG